MNYDKIKEILQEVHAERISQDKKWGEQNWPDGTCGDDAGLYQLAVTRQFLEQTIKDKTVCWASILQEEFFEVITEEDETKLRKELIQLAAVAVNWIEAIDRRKNV